LTQRKYLIWITALIALLYGCIEEEGCDEEEDRRYQCPRVNEGELYVKAQASQGYNLENVVLFIGNVEDEQVFRTLIDVDPSNPILVPPNTYSAMALYVKGKDTIVAIDGATIDAGGQTVSCSSQCGPSTPEETLDLRLK
jgi:hypothetical protein